MSILNGLFSTKNLLWQSFAGPANGAVKSYSLDPTDRFGRHTSVLVGL